jgi:hypothetical protein
MNQSGAHTSGIGVDRFGSWDETLDAAGLDPDEKPQRGRTPVSEDEYIAAIQRLGAELGRAPSSLEMTEQGEYAHTTGINLFGTWASVLAAAGYDPIDPKRQAGYIHTDDYLAAVRELADELGRPPTGPEMREQGEYSPTVGRRRWGSWEETLEAAGLEPPR